MPVNEWPTIVAHGFHRLGNRHPEKADFPSPNTVFRRGDKRGEAALGGAGEWVTSPVGNRAISIMVLSRSITPAAEIRGPSKPAFIYVLFEPSLCKIITKYFFNTNPAPRLHFRQYILFDDIAKFMKYIIMIFSQIISI
jgi:hypothetical protein